MLCAGWHLHTCVFQISEECSLQNGPLDEVLYHAEAHLTGGGGKGKDVKEQEHDEVGRAISKLKKFGACCMEPQHLRVLLQAKPVLTAQIHELQDKERMVATITKFGKKAHLPIIDQQCTLFQADWDVPVTEQLMPGREGVAVAHNMEHAETMLHRMKGMQGAAVIVALDRLQGAETCQKQMTISMGLKQAGAYVVRPSLVWIIQAGARHVFPKNTAPEITVKPRKENTLVTAVTFPKGASLSHSETTAPGQRVRQGQA